MRGVAIDHGLPRNYVPDTHVVRNALGMARDRNPVPQVGEYSTYPNLMPYMLLPVYVGYYLHGLFDGAWTDPRGFADHVLAHPEEPHLLARWLVALLSSLTPLVVFGIARSAGLGRGAWVAGWLVATGLLHLQLSLHERPWAPLMLFTVLAGWASVLWARDGRSKWLVLAGGAAGLAFATHQAGLLALGLPALAWVCGAGGRPDGRRRPFRPGFVCVLTFLVVGIMLGHPYYLVHGAGGLAGVAAGETVAEQGGVHIGGQGFIFAVRKETFEWVSRALLGYDPVVLLLGLAGLFAAYRRRTLRASLVWVTVWGVFFMANQGAHIRYLMPVTVLLALPAGLVAERLARHRAGMLVLALLLAVPLVQAVRLVQVLSRPDVRESVEDALYRLPLGSRVAVDRYGPAVDLSLGALLRLQELREACGAGLTSLERNRKRLLQDGKIDATESGLDVVPLADVLVFDERAWTVEVRRGLVPRGSDPTAVLRNLGVTHLLVVERRRDPGRPRLLAQVIPGRAPIGVFDPAAGRAAREHFLPTEMDFPLSAIWLVDRPGPYMELHVLR